MRGSEIPVLALVLKFVAWWGRMLAYMRAIGAGGPAFPGGPADAQRHVPAIMELHPAFEVQTPRQNWGKRTAELRLCHLTDIC
jgi:hypothetical protein